MTPEERPDAGRSVSRAIETEHRGLDALFAESRNAFRRGDPAAVLGTAFARLRESLDTHFAQEGELYFPSIWALRPGEKAELLALLDAHEDFRARLGEIERQIEDGALVQSARTFDALAEAFAQHEAAEERVLGALDRDLTAAP